VGHIVSDGVGVGVRPRAGGRSVARGREREEQRRIHVRRPASRASRPCDADEVRRLHEAGELRCVVAGAVAASLATCGRCSSGTAEAGRDLPAQIHNDGEAEEERWGRRERSRRPLLRSI